MAGYKMAKGASVPFPKSAKEGYQMIKDVRSCSFIVNIGLDKLKTLLSDYLEGLQEPLFFILEIPTHKDVEATLRKNNNEPFHSDVLYIDGCSKEKIKNILEQYGELLLHDGMVCFGIASHVTHDELYVGKYKTTNLHVFEYDPSGLLERLQIPKAEKLETVWNTFSKDLPGEAKILRDCETIYDMAEQLKKEGLYFYEHREC